MLEPHIGKILHVDVFARTGLGQQDLLEIRGKFRPRGSRSRQLIGSCLDIARPAQHRSRAIDGGDARIAFESPGQLLHRLQEIRVQRMAGRSLQPQLNHIQPVGLLEMAGILGHALAGIDVGQYVHFEGERCQQRRECRTKRPRRIASTPGRRRPTASGSGGSPEPARRRSRETTCRPALVSERIGVRNSDCSAGNSVKQPIQATISPHGGP